MKCTNDSKEIEDNIRNILESFTDTTLHQSSNNYYTISLCVYCYVIIINIHIIRTRAAMTL